MRLHYEDRVITVWRWVEGRLTKSAEIDLPSDVETNEKTGVAYAADEEGFPMIWVVDSKSVTLLSTPPDDDDDAASSSSDAETNPEGSRFTIALDG